MPEQPSSSITSDVQRDDENRTEAAFEQVDWDEVGGWRQYVTLKRVLLLVGVLAVADLYNYHRSTGELFLVWRYDVGPEDLLLMLSFVVLFTYVVVPQIRHVDRLKRTLRRLRRHWGTALSLVFLAVVLGLGIWVIVRGFIPRNTLVYGDSYDTLQPPVWASVPYRAAGGCVGPVTTEAGTRICHGTWTYPLGTDGFAYKMTDLLAMGTKPVVYATFVTAGLIVPLATIVGIVAGYIGGVADDALMAYVDIQLSLPAIIIYILAYMFYTDSKFVFILAFGLLSWGGIARIVRSETLQCREQGYVLAARAIGAPRWYVIRRHIFPNVTNSVIPATFHLIAVIVLTEAGLALLGFEPFTQSWGQTIGGGFQYGPPLTIWWNSVIPTVALAVTVLAFKIAGDGLRDVLDPRGET